MEIKYWIDKWNTGDTKFHRPEYQPALVKLFPAEPPGTVFVPLCGKTRDMLWFVEKGWNVVGVEASDLACRAFFEENGVEYREQRRGDFNVFTSLSRREREKPRSGEGEEGCSITLWCGDFFSIKKGDIPEITAVYDRASLIALPPDMRVKYAAHIRALLPPQGVKYFLITVEYLQDKVAPPPFSVDAAEIKRLYGDAFKITELRRRMDTVIPSVNAKFSGVEVWEVVYMMERPA